MKDLLVLEKPVTPVRERKITDEYVPRHTTRRTMSDNAFLSLDTEEGEAFYKYINQSKTVIDSSVVVLSPKHHYYYDKDELKEVSAVINLKRLNFMAHLDNYLRGICDTLSQNSKFIGCFADRKSIKGEKISARIYKRILTFLDGKTDLEIDKKYLLRLFESCGFRIIDMTEINGLTYFTTIRN